MSDFDRPNDDGALLSAWLSGDLDPADAETVERRLASEPELSARLERVHGLLVALRGLDTVDPPEGMSERLRRRLDQERQEVPSLAAARARRATRWQPILGAAAAVVLLAVLVPVLARSAGDSATTAAPARYAEEEGAGADEAAEAPEAAALDAEQEAASESAGAGAEALRDLAGPVVTDGGERSESDFQRHAAEVPEAMALIGLPVEEGRRLAGEYAAQLQAVEAFTSGLAPDACLDQVRSGLRFAIPARVERFTVVGQPRLGYVLVTASPGSDVLDRVETPVADPALC